MLAHNIAPPVREDTLRGSWWFAEQRCPLSRFPSLRSFPRLKKVCQLFPRRTQAPLVLIKQRSHYGGRSVPHTFHSSPSSVQQSLKLSVAPRWKGCLPPSQLTRRCSPELQSLPSLPYSSIYTWLLVPAPCIPHKHHKQSRVGMSKHRKLLVAGQHWSWPPQLLGKHSHSHVLHAVFCILHVLYSKQQQARNNSLSGAAAATEYRYAPSLCQSQPGHRM